ncbi:PAAR domain-containing protein [Pantoea sp. Ap-967]|uniref:PAAR domain-containing protein n=1 Tax=Pantoea sp. Ap-967 TaxID=2608362 RepID=UPI0014218F69|nr:PAAR domain-containing protein [Pantoea sp. Ap-967]NIE77417.1 PAAR domain-containing protein [Pantoea sp. Ap-967]
MRTVMIDGKGQAVDGDSTTTGAICVATGNGYFSEGRRVLRCGDPTTACPMCGEEGVVVEGCASFISDGQPVAVDGSLVACGCPSGRNRVIASMTGALPSGSTLAPGNPASTALSPGSQAAGLEPGFHIVQRSMSFEQVLASLDMARTPLPISLLQRLNPSHGEGFKAGEIFVLGSAGSEFACSPGETELMMVAEKVRESLGILTKEEANFMMQHIGEIAGVLSGASQSMGVGKDMLERGVSQVKDTLKGIEALHQQQFTLHGHLKSPEFFASRQQLYKQLDSQLRTAFLNKSLGLGNYDKLRRDLGISTKSLVHHWKKAGVPGNIPGYATHLDEVAKVSKYLKYGGGVGIGLGAGSSSLKVHEACREGETAECKKIRFTEAGSFSGGLVGGALGAAAGKTAAVAVCKFGGWGKAACGIVTVSGLAFGTSKGVEAVGEYLGEQIYGAFYD